MLAGASTSLRFISGMAPDKRRVQLRFCYRISTLRYWFTATERAYRSCFVIFADRSRPYRGKL